MKVPQLTALRNRRFLSMAELGKAADVDLSTIQRLEKGGDARGNTIRKLATALEVAPDALVQDGAQQN